MVEDFPLVVIYLLTYQRTEYALRAVKHTKDDLAYPNLKWYVGDNGSHETHYNAVLEAVGEENLIGSHTEAGPPGVMWNHTIREVYKHTDFAIRLEDDWAPSEKVFIWPWVKMLREREDICMVRMGYQHVPADMEAIGWNGIHYYRYSKNTRYCFGGHPAIIHRRFHDAYGGYNEEKNPGDIETDLDERVRAKEGPSIVRPAEIGGWGCFKHFGEGKSY